MTYNPRQHKSPARISPNGARGLTGPAFRSVPDDRQTLARRSDLLSSLAGILVGVSRAAPLRGGTARSED